MMYRYRYRYRYQEHPENGHAWGIPKLALLWPSKDENWLGTHDGHAPVSQTE